MQMLVQDKVLEAEVVACANRFLKATWGRAFIAKKGHLKTFSPIFDQVLQVVGCLAVYVTLVFH